MARNLTWERALAWRMRRHMLDPIGDPPVVDVVRRLCGVQAQVASSAELAVRVRRRSSRAGEVSAALADGRLVKTWAMRGTLHLLTPDVGAALLSLMASGRSWERPSWQRYFRATPAVMETLRGVVRDALGDRALTREELVAAVAGHGGVGHIADELRSGWGTLLKPLAWQGDLVFGPSEGNRVTFVRPQVASPGWSGLPPPDEAAPVAIAAYLGAHGPATVEQFGHWLAGGWFGRRQLKTWFDRLGDRLSVVEVSGERAFVRTEDLDELMGSRPTRALRLLPGFDQYVLGPGTGDGRVTAKHRRARVSRQSGWIAPVVVTGGTVTGTWEVTGDALRVEWFGEAGRPPWRALRAESARISEIIDRRLSPQVEVSTD